MPNLSLNLFLTTFSKDYWGYVSVFETNNTNLIESQNWDLKSVGNNKSSLTADLSGNSIVFSPMIVDDSNNFWFIKDENENYVPQKQLITTLYQETQTDSSNDIFSFVGNFESNTLKTKYDIPYTILAFIGAYYKVPGYPGKLNLIHEVNSKINTLGNFNLEMDVSQFINVTHLQWGFKMSGYPVYPTESGNQGSVIITDAI